MISCPQEINLFKKKVIDDPNCPICLQQVESIEHVIWECEAARDVWGLYSRQLQKRSIRNQSFRELVTNLMEVLNKEMLTEMAVVAWRLCKRRNEAIFQKVFTSPSILWRQIHQKLQDLSLLNHKPPHSSSSNVMANSMDQWKAPLIDHYKINWDAAIDHKNCRVGIGTIIRNWEGQVMGTMKMNRPLYPDPYLAESYAALQATLLGVNMGLRKIILEGDALKVVKEINGDNENWGQAGMIISEVK
ncbi:uncharacterized protein LOC122312683 [Carya illinoinensis]|uniref:uncharacterized protein LOC122312683 n=1 Tax=Carya illinoinensis TaxID=32201 RepID=UPI001C71F150|nr:uncharacterized protein LOC122312683 [Carya illinoinensis]